MLTDVVRADKDEEISRGEDEDKAGEARADFVCRHGALNLFLSNIIPADRCLAGQNMHIRGGRREGGNEEDLQMGIKGGHAIPPLVPPRRSRSPSSTDLETIDFIPAFAPEEGEVASDYQGGARRTRCGTKNKMQSRCSTSRVSDVTSTKKNHRR